MDNEIRFGKPCIRGTRICVGDILGWLSAGMTIPEIIEDYPELLEVHIRAALAIIYQAKSSIVAMHNNDEYGLLEIM